MTDVLQQSGTLAEPLDSLKKFKRLLDHMNPRINSPNTVILINETYFQANISDKMSLLVLHGLLCAEIDSNFIPKSPRMHKILSARSSDLNLIHVIMCC